MTLERPTHVLLMEDDPGQARLAQRTLERAGYVVHVAYDGSTGLELYNQGQHDVIIVDHQMPHKGGIEVLRSLALHGSPPPTIMVTAHGDEALAVEAMQLGAGDYVVKDAHGRYFKLLPAVIERVLEQRRLFAAKRHAEEALQRTLEELEERVKARTAELHRANAHLRAEIAERQQAEEALASLSRRYTLILQSASEGIYGIDAAGKTTFVNPAAAQMLRWESTELLGQHFQTVLYGIQADSTPRNECPIFAVLRDGTARQVPEVVFWRQDGSSFLVEYSCAPIREADAVAGAVVIFKDITARKRAEQEMQRADRLALVGQLASGLAHEIGTPLNVISGNAEYLRPELQAHGMETLGLDTIVEQTDRITRLIQQLLTFARAEGQTMAPLHLYEPLSHVLRLLETRFRQEAITVIVDVPTDLPLIWGAADECEQVFLNILVNAWHAMPAGGTLTIQAKAVASKHVQVSFCDSGVGMSEATVARVFEPFFSTKGEKGTGLGLAICKQIIDHHGGSIRLSSAPGRGTTVTVELLRAEAVES